MGCGRYLRKALLLAASALVCATAVHAQPGQGEDGSLKKRQVETAVAPAIAVAGYRQVSLQYRMAQLHVPGLSIAVIHKGALAWTGAYGTASRAAEVTSDTRFPLAQMTMPLAALGALKLAEQYKIDLDADVERYLVSWHFPPNDFTQRRPVTLRELLSHTAGVTGGAAAPLSLENTAIPVLAVLKGAPPAANPPVTIDTAPGRQWRVSAEGYAVVQQLTEDVSHQPFENYLAQRVLMPLGMQHSGFVDGAAAAADATGHDSQGNELAKRDRYSSVAAAAGLWSTPTDVSRFILELQRALKGKSTTISKANAEKMLSQSAGTNAGLGLLVRGAAGHRSFQFSGATEGFAGAFIADEDGEGAVVLTNSSNGAELVEEVLRTISVAYGWPYGSTKSQIKASVPAEVMNRYVGFYQLGKYRYLEVQPLQDHLMVRFQTGEVREIFPAAEQVWYFADDGDIVNFDLGTDNRAKAITDHHQGLATAAVRIPPAMAPDITAALRTKIASKAADPAAEAWLRHYVEEVRTGSVDFDGEMTPAVAAAQQGMQSDYRALLSRLGRLQTIRFQRVTDAGADLYNLYFEHGALSSSVLIGNDHKAESLTISIQPVDREKPAVASLDSSQSGAAVSASSD